MKNSITSLQTKGYFNMAYPADLRTAVQDTVATWQAFCSLPEEVKRKFPYSNMGAGDGYENKSLAGPSKDAKENFDVSMGGFDWLAEQADLFGDEKVVAFIESAAKLVHFLKPLILDFADQAEREFGIQNFKDEVQQSEPGYFVRFIHYFGDQEEGKETAEVHTDQSGFTFHLFENAPGLQCLTFNKQWIDMPVSEGETVIIPAMQLQLRSEGKLKALCHRVIATEQTSKEGRFSAVCFIQLKNTPKYDKTRCGRLQDLHKAHPGFNYDLSHQEFGEYFKL